MQIDRHDGAYKMNINYRLKLLRNEMCRHNIEAYIVPTCDFHGSEYIGEYFKTREYISGFTGSAGTAIVTMEEAVLWTDGRYFLQAASQLEDSEFILMKSGEPDVPTMKEYISQKMRYGSVIGFDGRMMPASLAEDISGIEGICADGNMDLIGEIWKERPEISCKPVWRLPEKYTGMTYVCKIAEVRKEIKDAGADILVITSLDEIAWLLNLRGNDVECTPVFMAFMIVTEKESILFIQQKALDSKIKELLEKDGVIIKNYYDVYGYLEKISHKRLWIDKETANYNIIKSVHNTNNIINRFTPVLTLKAVKNPIEAKNMRQAHLLDGVAMTKFIFWLKKNVGKICMSEISLGEKLEEFRKRAESYIEPSFKPIVAYNEHGAVVHYSATEETCYEIKPEGIILIDSGGQYLEGTTDITRTISLGNVSDKMKEMYTAVLRGNLNLAAAVFKEGCTGVSLDYLARKPLWDKGMDYNHGTGHGVGYLLNVHESPNAFRYRIMENPQMNSVLKPGMITSDEPGVYLENEFGIRIENLLLCVEKEKNQYGRFLGFETLTFVPFDRELINVDEMTAEEQKLLKQYNEKVYREISPYLTEEEKRWLRENQ